MNVKTLMLCLFAAAAIAQTGLFFNETMTSTCFTPPLGGMGGANAGAASHQKSVDDKPAPPDTTHLFFEQKLATRAAATAAEKLHLTLDRTLLAPGDDLWLACWLRDAATLGPSPMSDIVHVELLDPRGAVVSKKSFIAYGGHAAGDLHFDRNWAGGQYKLRAFTNWMKNSGEQFERDITLQKTVLPNLRLKLDFERKSHGPGEAVIAKFDAATLDNRPLAGKTVAFSVNIGGKEFLQNTAATGDNGRAWLRFELPKDLSTNDALLNLTLENDGRTEAISRAVPIVLGKIDLQFFPEGGDAVAGFAQKIAFKAVNEFGKPADVAGEVFNSKNERVAGFESFHGGMGAFELTQKPGETYSVRLAQPASCPTVFKLPSAVAEGLSLRFLEKKGSRLFFEIRSTRPYERAYLTGVAGDKLLSFNELEFGGGPAQVSIETADWPMGVARFTLFDEKMSEQAERLAFTGMAKQLKIGIAPDREKYLPRDRAKLKITARDGEGRPVKGRFTVAVCDDKLLTFADDKQGHLLSELMLQSDVRGPIDEPNFYFDPAEPKAEAALDHLLMTQGWRRFGWAEAIAAPPLALQNLPERARLAGRLTNFLGKRAMTREKLMLYPGGPSVETDGLGRFDFGQVDIVRYSHIQCKKDGFFPLDGFGENLDLVYANASAATGTDVWCEASPDGKTWLTGRVTEPWGDGAFAAVVKIIRNGKLAAGCQTDFDGNYSIKLDPGTYDIEFVYVGWTTERLSGIAILEGKKTHINKVFNGTEQVAVLTEAAVKAYAVPQIQQDNTAQGMAFTADEIRSLPTQNLDAIVAVTAGIAAIDGSDVAIRGNRDAEVDYYIDGVRAAPADRSAAKKARADYRAPEVPLQECVVVSYSAPLIQPDNLTSGATFTSNGMSPVFRTIMSQPNTNGYYNYNNYYRRPKKEPYRPERQLAYHRARQFYAPNYGRLAAPAQRTDFRPTIFWSPLVETDEKGEATVEFSTSDALTTFRATVEGIGANRQPGRAESRFFAQKPVQIDCKLPFQVLTGDVLKLPVSIKNNTAKPVSGKLVAVLPPHFLVKNQLPEAVQIAAGGSKVIEIECEIGRSAAPPSPRQRAAEGQPAGITLQFLTKAGAVDELQSTIKTAERGFPVAQVFSGKDVQTVLFPKLVNPIDGTVSAKITAYPSVLEDLSASMERMLRQPSGCFEQVSSSNYPNLLVLDFLKKTGQLRPETEARARLMLEEGYKKLVGYESKSGGFDWYGRDPGHEALTAYGIVEFTDMGRVFAVDQKMVERTAEWLLSRRDGKGGWKRNNEGYDSFSGSNVPNAYIVWALCEAGFGPKIDREIDAALKKAEADDDPYRLALLANALLKTGDGRAKPLISNLLQKVEADGGLPERGRTAMGGYGASQRVEATALMALALVRSKSTGGAGLKKAVDFLLKSKNEYGYGSTQSTVHALRALIEYAAQVGEKTDGGQLVVMVDGQRVAEESYAAGQLNPLKINGLEQFFKNTEPRVEVFFEKTKEPIAFDFELKYSASRPRDAKGCPLALTTSLDKTRATVGETVRLMASITNESGEEAASPMLIVGIPAGLALQPWQLKKLGDERAFDFYELWDGYAVFHFERLAAGGRRDIALDLRAEVPGRFEAPASQAFLYYSNEVRVFARPEAVAVQ